MTHLLPFIGRPNQLRQRRYGLLLALLLCLSAPAWAQRGKNGALTVTTAGSIVNTYTTLATDVTAGNQTITVASSALNTPAGRFTAALGNQDLVMVIQMQGASIDVSDNINYGSVTSYNSAGRYEIMEVQSVTATTITFTCALRNSYSVGGRTQIVRIPRLSSLTVNSGASITASAWNGASGGIVAVEVQNNTIINGTINVNGLGFRGGAADNNSADAGTTNSGWRGTADTYGGEKGEGIAGSQATYDGLNGRYGRGPAANGGGGGNSHNAAGGGGANAGVGTWTGLGNPDRGPANAYDAAWNLESANFATSSSPGGGRGGYTYASTDANALTAGPGNTVWGGNARQNAGGYGGRPLDISGRVFFGGGGGAGDGNNGGPVSGGNGGGLIYMITGGTVSGTGSLQANGATGFRLGSTTVQTANAQDGGGGGGGGGSIVLNVSSTISGITASAQGGVGSTQATTGAESEGPGAGGGGGFITYTNNSGTSFTRSVSGGANGITESPSLSEFPANGATRGGDGVQRTFLYNAQCAQVDVRATLTATANPTFAGQSGGFTVTFSNLTNNFNANDVVATVQLPVGLTNLAATGAAAYTYDATSGLLTYTGLTGLTASQVYSSVISFTTPGSGPVSATAEVSTSTYETALANNEVTTSFVVTPVADVTTTITGQDVILRNSVSTTYTVTFTNNGPSTAAGVTKTVTLPTGAIVRNSSNTQADNGQTSNDAPSATVQSTGTGNTAVTTLTYPTGALTSGQSVSYTFQFLYNDGPNPNSMTSNVGTSTAQSTTGGAGTAPDAFTLNLTETGTTANLSTTITASPTTATAGTTAQFNVSFVNSSGSNATGTVREVQLPAGLSGVTFNDNGTANSTNWNYNSSSGLVTYTAGGGTITLAGNTTRTLVIGFTAPGTGPVNATSTINSNAFDSNLSNNTASASMDITPSANVATTLSGQTTAQAGSVVTYTATVANSGPSIASNIAPTVQLARGLFNVTGGSYNFDTGVLTLASITSLGVGESQPYTITFQLPNNNQTVNGTASSTASTNDAVAANNNGSATAARVATTVTMPTGSCSGTTAGGTAATQGLYAEYFKGYHNEAINTFFNGKTADVARNEGTVNYTQRNAWGDISTAINSGTVSDPEGYTTRFRGLINITTAGVYTFTLNCDDGAYLWVGNSAREAVLDLNKVLINNGGGHAAFAASNTVTLPAGAIPLQLIYGEIGGDNTVILSYSGPDTNGNTVVVPQSVLCATRPTAALPVTLTRFDAKAAGLDAKLSWTTAQEKNNDRFEVERSADGVSFEKIGQVAGHGTVSTTQQYAYTDATAARFGRTVYYRLRQVDFDGTPAYSAVQAVSFGDVAEAVLYPNPATAELNVRLPFSADPLTGVTVYSAVGQQVLTQAVEGRQDLSLDVRKLPAGTYLLRLQTASGKTLTRRFVKQ
jgi:uncharacterized repeat protein (TIGR01451 family)